MITLKYIKSVKKVKVHIRGPWMMNRHDFGGPDSSASNTEVDICGSGLKHLWNHLVHTHVYVPWRTRFGHF